MHNWLIHIVIVQLKIKIIVDGFLITTGSPSSGVRSESRWHGLARVGLA